MIGVLVGKFAGNVRRCVPIEGTPAFIVGDRMIPGADMAALRAAITEAKTGKLTTVPDVKPS